MGGASAAGTWAGSEKRSQDPRARGRLCSGKGGRIHRRARTSCLQLDQPSHVREHWEEDGNRGDAVASGNCSICVWPLARIECPTAQVYWTPSNTHKDPRATLRGACSTSTTTQEGEHGAKRKGPRADRARDGAGGCAVSGAASRALIVGTVCLA